MSGTVKERALRMLARRDHSRVEMQRKLAGEDPPEVVEAVLDRMAELGLQSDTRFAESFVRGRAPRSGRRKLEQELAQRGVARDDIAAALESELGAGEFERARALWLRKFGVQPQDAREWAKQARFLAARGFSNDVVRRVLKEPFDESAQG